jgi:hypothetical protein
MMGWAWDPPSVAALALGIAALAAWLALASPRPWPRGGIRFLAALLLALALLDVGCRRGGGAALPRAVVLVDRSLSMKAAGRDADAREWVARLERSLAGWQIERHAFGGATTDLADAIGRAEARLPDAIVVVSDGRAAGGRAAEPPAVPLYAYAPKPTAIADLAVADLAVAEGSDGTMVEVEVAAVGGLGAASRALEITVGDKVVARRQAGAPLAAGERRLVRVAVPATTAGAIVEARLVGGDAVAANDRRARRTGPGAGPRAHLLVGLRPGWEMGFVRRALVAGGLPVETLWAPAKGRLAPLDRAGGAAWSTLSPERYRAVWLFGDPALLGAEGRAWVERFVGRGGRGVAWAPTGSGGELPGMGGARAPSPGRTRAVPSVTGSAIEWLVAHGGRDPDAAFPDGSAAWPPLELLPDAPAEPPAGAILLLVAGERPAAWIADRGAAGRNVVLLGTGYYRWALADDEAQRAFWRSWVATLGRWLAGAAAAAKGPLVRLPAGGRLTAGERLAAPVEATGGVAWRIEREPGGEVVVSGEIEAGADPVVRAGPFAPGIYRLLVERDEGAAFPSERFVVEAWAPDLAWTAADTASLARAARASGGELLGEDEVALRPPARVTGGEGGAVIGLGTTPWLYLVAVLLLLADWGLGRRAR